jgi:Flp pilus assembly protein TadD
MELAQLALWRSLIETGQDQPGIDLLNQVLAHNPKSLEAHVGLAAAYARAGRKEDAYRERLVCLGLAG